MAPLWNFLCSHIRSGANEALGFAFDVTAKDRKIGAGGDARDTRRGNC